MVGRRSSLVRPEVVAAFASQAEATMPESVTVTPRTATVTAAGGVTETVGTPVVVTGRLRRAGQQPDEVDRAGRYTVEQLWVIAVPTATTVALTSRCTVGSRSFEVVALLGVGSYDPELRVLVVEAT